MSVARLISSIPANNQKIIELFQKLQSAKLNKAPDFQRKKVWRRQHKIEFIDTILKNFPFPEIYVAPQKVDTQKLELTEQIVDGQQRLTTIQDYINGTDVFAQKTSISSFANLSTGEKEDFLNYEVSVRYLKNATEDQIKEIFQRINRTDYALNRMERFHAVWGDSELVCLAKQITEKVLEINLEVLDYKVAPADRDWLVQFFVTGDDEGDGLFSEAEVNRMLGLQYVLVLLVTMIRGEYFHRNSYIEDAVKSYNEKVPDAAILISHLVETTKFIASLELAPGSFWTNQSSLLTMIIEISKYDPTNIDQKQFAATLNSLEISVKAGDAEVAGAEQYYLLTREAVNARKSRETRSAYLSGIIQKCAML
jgi:hypothetical protein